MKHNIEDINGEYEIVFGKETRPVLFDADDDEYNTLRRQIAEAPRMIQRRGLPFYGIKILSYTEYLQRKNVIMAEKKGHRIFYIRRYEGTSLICYAAGYFNVKDSRFVVLKGSFSEMTDYAKSLMDSISSFKGRSELGCYKITDNVFIEIYNHSYVSASVAASLYLGSVATFHEWKNEDGYTLDKYYVKYKKGDI